jgi:hypothetical protein
MTGRRTQSRPRRPGRSRGPARPACAVPALQAGALLAELAAAHLLTEHRPDRYTSHDLLRAYAAEQAHALIPGGDRAAASHRILDHYLHTAYIAARLLKPERDPIDLAELTPGTVAEDLMTPDSALACSPPSTACSWPASARRRRRAWTGTPGSSPGR